MHGVQIVGFKRTAMEDLLRVRGFACTWSPGLQTCQEVWRKRWLLLGEEGGNQDRGGTSVRVPDSFTVVTGALAFSSASRPFSYYSVALLRQDWNVEAGVTKVRG